jgi:hypothetical protein
LPPENRARKLCSGMVVLSCRFTSRCSAAGAKPSCGKADKQYFTGHGGTEGARRCFYAMPSSPIVRGWCLCLGRWMGGASPLVAGTLHTPEAGIRENECNISRENRKRRCVPSRIAQGDSLVPVRNRKHLEARQRRCRASGLSVVAGSDKTLSLTLKELEADELIVRREYPQVPPKVEYSLSERGRSIIPVLDAMCEWGTKNRL